MWIAPAFILAVSSGWDAGFSFASFAALDHYALRRLLTSLLLALAATGMAALFALPATLLYFFSERPARAALTALALIPLSFPPFAVASAWMMALAWWEQGVTTRVIWGSGGWITGWLYTAPGAAFVLALCFWPIIFFLCALTMRLRQTQIEAARLYLSPKQCWLQVYLPAWKQPACLGSLLVFLVAFKQFETPSFLQVKVYSSEIYTRFASYLDPIKALVLCIPYAALLAVLAWMAVHMQRQGDAGSRDRIVLPHSRKTLFLFGGFSAAVFSLSILFPLAALIQQSGGVADLSQVVLDNAEIAARSLAICGLGGFCVALTGLIFNGFQTRRSRFALFLYLFWFTIPSIMIAAGWLEIRSLFHVAIPDAVAYITLILAGMNHYLIFGILAGDLLWQHFGKSQRESAALLSASLAQRILSLYAPSFASSMFRASALIAMFYWSEVAIFVLLQPPGGDTLTLKYYNLLHYGSDARTAGVGFMLLAVPAALVVLLYGINHIAMNNAMRKNAAQKASHVQR